MPLKCSGSHPSLKRPAPQLRFWAVASLEAMPRNPREEETFSEPDNTVSLAIQICNENWLFREWH